MPEERDKSAPIVKGQPKASLKEDLFGRSLLKPGEARSKPQQEVAQDTTPITVETVQAPAKVDAPAPAAPKTASQPSPASRRSRAKAHAETASATTSATMEAQLPAMLPKIVPVRVVEGPKNRREWGRPVLGAILRKREPSYANGRQVAVRLSAASTEQIEKIREAMQAISGFADPLKDAEFARVAIEFLLRVLDVTEVDLAQAYSDERIRYSLWTGEVRVESVLLDYLEKELLQRFSRE